MKKIISLITLLILLAAVSFAGQSMGLFPVKGGIGDDNVTSMKNIDNIKSGNYPGAIPAIRRAIENNRENPADYEILFNAEATAPISSLTMIFDLRALSEKVRDNQVYYNPDTNAVIFKYDYAVMPIKYNGIKYTVPGISHPGFVEAVDLKTGKTLWSRQVYEEKAEYISQMEIGGDKLVVRTDKGREFSLDLLGRE